MLSPNMIQLSNKSSPNIPKNMADADNDNHNDKNDRYMTSYVIRLAFPVDFNHKSECVDPSNDGQLSERTLVVSDFSIGWS